MWTIIGQVALSILGLYVITASVFLSLARININPEGNLTLDPNSRHFRITFPAKRYSPYEIRRLSGTLTLCGYFARFFLMLYAGWPILATWVALKTVLYSPFMLMFGYYPVADLQSMIGFYGHPFFVRVKSIKLPEVKGFTLFPAYAVILLSYLFFWIYWPGKAWQVTFWALTIIGAVAVLAGVSAVHKWLQKTDQESVSLIKEWVTAKIRRACPLVEIQ